MAKIKIDSDLVRIAKQIDSHLGAIRVLEMDLEDAEHPGAKAFLEGLDYNSLTAFAWAEHIVHAALIHPDHWQTDRDGIHYTGKRKE